MPDFHQPDEEDRRRAEASGIADRAVPALSDEAAELQEERPSSANDPNAPDRPKT